LEYKKIYQNKIFVVVIQTLSIVCIALAHIDTIFKLMLVFGYVMLFRQERWHKHLLIMFVMISIMCVASGGFSTIMLS